MNCSDIAEILDNRNVEQLGAAERQDVEAHLAACTECARDWELHAAFSALTDMREPTGFLANCRAVVTAGSSSGRSHRMRSRLVLIGVFAAVAAAAGMLAVALREPELTRVTAPQEPSAPFLVGGEAPPQVAVPDEQEPAVTESAHVEVAVPVTESTKFAVRILPVRNNGADATSRAAINVLHAAVIRELQAIPGLILVDTDSVEMASDVPVTYQVKVVGDAGREPNLWSATVTGEKLGPDGKSGPGAATHTMKAPACPAGGADSKYLSCHDPALIASHAIDHVRTRLFPFDLAAQRLLQADLMDVRLGFDARLAALSVFAARSDVAGSKASALSDPAVVRGAIELATSNADQAQRAHVWRTMRGARHTELIPPLIAASRQGQIAKSSRKPS